MIEITDNIGERRLLMPLENQRVTKAFRVFGDAGSAPLIPEKDWKPVDSSHAIALIKDQDGVGQCNAEATVYCAEAIRALDGMPYVELSAANLYGRINGGRDQGSLLEDAIEEINKVGVCSAKTVGRLDWRPNGWPTNWKQEAQRYRILEWWWCPTAEHLVSAAMHGWIMNIGMMWGSGDNTDADGFLPDKVSGQAGGHAVCRAGFLIDSKRGPYFPGPNSWSMKWGAKGWMNITLARLKREEGNFGWFAARSVTIPSGDMDMPQAV